MGLLIPVRRLVETVLQRLYRVLHGRTDTINTIFYPLAIELFISEHDPDSYLATCIVKEILGQHCKSRVLEMFCQCNKMFEPDFLFTETNNLIFPTTIRINTKL